MNIMKKFHLLFILGLCLPALPTSAQTNPRAMQKALYDGTQYLFHPNNLGTSLQKTITLQTLATKIASDTKPAIYTFPIRPSLYPKRDGTLRVVPSISPQTTLIPGATFRPLAFVELGHNYTGTVFKDGDDIFGVVALHALRWQMDEEHNAFDFFLTMVSLNKKFPLEVYDTYGRASLLQAEVVQIGAMQDLALVKFHSKDEKKLSPLLLRTQEISAETPLHVQGFNQDQQLVHLSGLSVFRVTPTFMQMYLPGNSSQRSGMCGSPIMDKENRLAGIFIGHKKANGKTHKLDIGYVAPLSSLKTVIAAYRNGGQTTFPLQLNGQTIIQLKADEWVNRVYLFDEENDFVWGSGPIRKFSYRQIEEKINELSAAYLMMDIFKITWSRDGELKKIPLKQVRYNFSEKRIEWEDYE